MSSSIITKTAVTERYCQTTSMRDIHTTYHPRSLESVQVRYQEEFGLVWEGATE